MHLTELDESQQQVVGLHDGYFLVLAPPGCGKTHILAERIRRAHESGVSYDDMLCLTFTNRAAREMQRRSQSSSPNAHPSTTNFTNPLDHQPFIGNVHRYCSKFLFEARRVPSDTSVIDDEEAVSIIADFRNEDDETVMTDYRRWQDYQRIIFLSHLMEQQEHHHPHEIYIHPEVAEFLDNERAVTYARQYAQYKHENHLLDFEDLLIETYNAYREDATCRKYRWIQIDEVQDLNAMQLAIIDLLTADDAPTVMYLGDEQQAIFSFMGAKVETLGMLKERCRGRICHLKKNHRSPGYLLDVFNEYAEKTLHIDRALLPTTEDRTEATNRELQIVHSSTMQAEVHDVAVLATQLHRQYADETTAVIVNANADADRISEEMESLSLNHFKVSGRDLFDTKEMKLLLAHLSVAGHERNFIAWARLMKGLKVFPTNPLARRFLRKLRQLGISPTDFLIYDDATYVSDFADTYEKQELVVFDTETTGVNPQEDDVIEIAAMRVRQGRVVGEPLDLYIRTDKEIPAMLGTKENPLKTLYDEKAAADELMEADEALRVFTDYVGNRPVVGHNVMFDIQMVRALKTKLAYHDDKEMLPSLTGKGGEGLFDTLKLMHLLEPNLHSYKLESLLEQFSLSGENSHRAIDDVGATVNLLALCYEKARQRVDEQLAFIRHPRVRPFVNKWCTNYQELYLHTQAQLYRSSETSQPPLIAELIYVHDRLCEEQHINKVEKLNYLVGYLLCDMLVDDSSRMTLSQQLSAHIMELNTMRESDFCNSRSMQDKVYVTTIHKAKGLEFDNVIVFDAVAGRYPNHYNKHPRQDAEDARKFYVAMSRARKRLFVAYSMQSIDRYGGIHNRELTPFMNDILKYFN